MDTNTLVNNYILQGRRLISSLDAENYPVTACFWYYFSEPRSWRLIIASPRVDQGGALPVYQFIQTLLPQTLENQEGFSLKDITVIGPTNPLILLLRTAIQTPPNAIAGINFSGNTINNTFIEGAYIYRLT